MFYSICSFTSVRRKAAVLDCVWNVMAHAQKPYFVFRWNGPVHLNRRGTSVQSTTGSRVVRISGSNAGYTMFRGSVRDTGYPLHSPVSPLLRPHPRASRCAIMFQLDSTTLIAYFACNESPQWALPVRFKQSAVTEFLTGERGTADETWVHLYKPETKRQSVKYHRKWST